MQICIAHFRIGLADGVSLQIDERLRILKQLGHEVYTIDSSKSPIGDLKIPYLDYKENPIINRIQSEAFGDQARSNLMSDIEKIAGEIEVELGTFWEQHRFSLIFIHNIFSLPVCLPATLAFYGFLKNHPQITAIGVHHDFYWDPPRVNLYKPVNAEVEKFLGAYYPPVLPNLKNAVISSWEQKELKKRTSLDSEVMTDTFDFDQYPWVINADNKDFPKDVGINEEDLVLLIASRIRPRKGIELGIEFVARMNELIKTKQVIPGKSRAVLVLPNDYMDKETDYVNLLKKKAEKIGVEVKWIQNLIGSQEEKNKGMKKYSLWDSYVYADAILYPSLWEGFGNQFLEAVFAKKPIVSLEYPIYKTDIEPAGFEVAEIADELTFDKDGLAMIDPNKLKKPLFDLINIFTHKKLLRERVEKNFIIAKQKFNTKLQLRKYLTEESTKFVVSHGLKNNLSPLILSGELIGSGVAVQHAYSLAETIISKVPQTGISGDDYFRLIVDNLFSESRERFVTLALVKEYLTSTKSRSPLFIFVGGLAGKSTLSNFVVQHLGISQPIVFDNEKYRIAKPGQAKPYLWKATYETKHGYMRTNEALYPYIEAMIKRNIFDYTKYRKWCYFWEGIYLSAEVVQKLQNKFPEINYISVFNLPKLEDIKNQYVLRWYKELGTEKLEKKRNVIDRYLKNVEVIKSHITENIDKIASFVIESSVLEERLNIFYTLFYQSLKDIADKEIPGWVEKITENPKELQKFRKFLLV